MVTLVDVNDPRFAIEILQMENSNCQPSNGMMMRIPVNNGTSLSSSRASSRAMSGLTSRTLSTHNGIKYYLLAVSLASVYRNPLFHPCISFQLVKKWLLNEYSKFVRHFWGVGNRSDMGYMLRTATPRAFTHVHGWLHLSAFVKSPSVRYSLDLGSCSSLGMTRFFYHLNVYI